jgi:hypothetical protein
MTYTDHRSTRGVLIVWNDVRFPFQVKRTWIDGEDKRAVSIELQGGKGISLTLTCGYFENIAAGEDKQTKFYNFLARGIPNETTARPKTNVH